MVWCLVVSNLTAKSFRMGYKKFTGWIGVWMGSWLLVVTSLSILAVGRHPHQRSRFVIASLMGMVECGCPVIV